MFEVYGGQRVWLNSACDWGRSDPLAVPKTALEMRRRGHSDETIDKLVFQNPIRFLEQNPPLPWCAEELSGNQIGPRLGA